MGEEDKRTVTFVFTDIEGSTALWDSHAASMRIAEARHDELLRAAFERFGGRIVVEKGEGDSLFVLFESASDALRGAIEGQAALDAEVWPEGLQIRVRMAIHTADADRSLHGSETNRAARLRSLALGGQVLISEATFTLARDHLDAGTQLVSLGEYPLRGLLRPEIVYELRDPRIPGGFPPPGSNVGSTLTNVPPARGPTFVGREDVLAHLAEGPSHSGRPRTWVLSGIGGVGKSATARHFAESVEAQAAIIWWIDAASPESAAQGLADLATAGGISSDDNDLAAHLDGLFGSLSARGDWVIVYDNVTDIDAMRDLFPNHGGGTVVITTRTTSWPEPFDGVELLGLPPSDAVAILSRGWRSTHANELESLGERLGGHPLALWQATSYGRMTGTSVSEYKELLESRITETLERGNIPQDYPLSTESAVALTLGLLPPDQPTAGLLLFYFSFFADLPIPYVTLEMLSHPERFGGTPDRGTRPDDLEVRDGIAALRSLSLVSFADDRAIRVHPIVSGIVRAALGSERAEEFIHGALHIMDAALSAGSPVSLTDQESFAWHAKELVARDDLREAYPEDVLSIVHQASNLFMTMGHYDAGLSVLEGLADLASSTYGKRSAQLSGSLNALGIALQVANRLDEAEESLRQAISISKRLGNARELAVQRGNLALVLADQGRFDVALAEIEEALDGFSPGSEDRRMQLAKKAIILGKAGKSDDSFELAAQAASEEGAIAPHHEMFLLRTLADSQGAIGRNEDAAATLRAAMILGRESLGDNAPVTSKVTTELLDNLIGRGDTEGIREVLSGVPGLTVVWEDGVITKGPGAPDP